MTLFEAYQADQKDVSEKIEENQPLASLYQLSVTV
jgi:hypothetical protein